jgi:hypothetical protein
VVLSGDSERVPVTICWHCDRPLDAATGIDDAGKPSEGAVSLCLYCGAVAVFGPDLTMLPPTEELLDELAHDREFRETFTRFAWSRQYVMRNASLLRDREDPDR